MICRDIGRTAFVCWEMGSVTVQGSRELMAYYFRSSPPGVKLQDTLPGVILARWERRNSWVGL